MSGSSFHLDGVEVAYNGAPVLAVERLRVEAGEAVAFVGPSGAGKTTLLRCLAAALRPRSGRIDVGATPVGELGPRALRRLRASIGFVHQDLNLIPNLRVVQNVVSGRFGRRSFAAAARSILFPSRGDVAEAHALLERVGIGEKLYERTDRLSGGERQRVAIARALFQQPCALLADEPVSSVDPARARDTILLLRRLCEEGGLTLCASLHNLELARECFPRIVGLRHGAVVFDRAAAEVEPSRFAELYELEDAGGKA